jgi:hypothetical protein
MIVGIHLPYFADARLDFRIGLPAKFRFRILCMPLPQNPHLFQILDMPFEAGFLKLEGSWVACVSRSCCLSCQLGIHVLEFFAVTLEEGFHAIGDFLGLSRKPEPLGTYQFR